MTHYNKLVRDNRDKIPAIIRENGRTGGFAQAESGQARRVPGQDLSAENGRNGEIEVRTAMFVE